MTLTANTIRQRDLLTQYLRLIWYPELLHPEADILTPEELCLSMHDQFVIFLDVKQSDWIDAFTKEWVYLCNLLGWTETNALLILRSDIVSEHLYSFN